MLSAGKVAYVFLHHLCNSLASGLAFLQSDAVQIHHVVLQDPELQTVAEIAHLKKQALGSAEITGTVRLVRAVSSNKAVTVGPGPSFQEYLNQLRVSRNFQKRSIEKSLSNSFETFCIHEPQLTLARPTRSTVKRVPKCIEIAPEITSAFWFCRSKVGQPKSPLIFEKHAVNYVGVHGF